MENASRALLIAGGVLISIIVISLFMLMMNSLTDYQQSNNQSQRQKQLVAFNNQFEGYLRDDVSGVDMISLINKVVYYNRTQSTAGTGELDTGKEFGYEPITLELEFPKINGQKSTFLLAMNSSNQLFKNDKYIFDATTSLKNTIIDNGGINYVEKTLKDAKMPNPPNDIMLADKYKKDRTIYYSAGIWKNLVENLKSSDSIFNDDFKSLDLKEKYKRINAFNENVGDIFFPLSDKDSKPIEDEKINKWWEDYFSDKASKESDTTHKTIKEDLALYYEYDQFKRGIFKYVQSDNLYDENTGRIKYMKFQFTGDFM